MILLLLRMTAKTAPAAATATTLNLLFMPDEDASKWTFGSEEICFVFFRKRLGMAYSGHVVSSSLSTWRAPLGMKGIDCGYFSGLSEWFFFWFYFWGLGS